MKYFFSQLRFVKFKDYIACFVFICALPVSWIYRIKRKNLWLICERADEARDNGFFFYKYMREKHPEQDCVYAIKKASSDYEKVSALHGEIIEFSSFKHWVYYLAADINISSQKEGKPNAAVCHLLEIYGLRKNRRVYLKHGIVKDDLKWHYYDVMKVWLYTCAAQREYEYCKNMFHYPDDCIVLTGLSRYDNLEDKPVKNKFVLIMPTSREWLARPIKEYEKYDDVSHFENTEYYHYWKSLLETPEFIETLNENGMSAVFFLHPNMQKYSKYFAEYSDYIKIATNDTADLQTLMREARVLITDYSSIYFDFAYMRKPLLYYQFDYEKYREGHYQEGYFSYERDGFGKVEDNPESLARDFRTLAEHDFVMESQYEKRVEDFFAFHDFNNCERIYQAICRKRKNHGE